MESSKREAVHIFGTLSRGRWPRRPGRGAWGFINNNNSNNNNKKKIKALLRSIHRIALHPNKLTKLIYAKKLTNS